MRGLGTGRGMLCGRGIDMLVITLWACAPTEEAVELPIDDTPPETEEPVEEEPEPEEEEEELDEEPPEPVSLEPADGAEGASATPTIEVVFNEPIDAAQIPADALSVDGRSGVMTIHDDRLTLTLDQPLTCAAEITVEIAPIPDLAGNLSEAFSWSFSTGEGGDWAPLANQPGTAEEAPFVYDPWHDFPLTPEQSEQMEAWYRDGSAAGFDGDIYQSFDDGHSNLRDYIFTGMNILEPTLLDVPTALIDYIIPTGITFASQSMALSTYERHYGESIVVGYYTQFGIGPDVWSYGYDRNFLVAYPGLGSYLGGEEKENDKMMWMNPGMLVSFGGSGSDVDTLSGALFAAAAMPPELKAHAMEEGRYAHTLNWLFRRGIVDDYHSPEAHTPATDPALVWEKIWDIIELAHSLDHLPPRVVLETTALEDEGKSWSSTHAYFGILEEGDPPIVLEADVSGSFADQGGCIESYSWDVLRGGAATTIVPLNEDGSRVQIEIGWDPDFNRTDILVLASDGVYESPPAYITIDQYKL